MTDNQQASEDVLIELATKFDMDEYGTVNENGGYLIGEVRKLIRTEKLKLLAEIRVRVVDKPTGNHNADSLLERDVLIYNQATAYLRTELTKLEAEL